MKGLNYQCPCLFIKKEFKSTGTFYTKRCENIISVAMEIFEFAFYGLLWTDLKLHTAIANCCSLSWCSFWQALDGIGCTQPAIVRARVRKYLVHFWDLLKYKSVSEKKNFHAMTSGELRSTSVFLVFVGRGAE